MAPNRWEFQDPKCTVPYKAIFSGDILLHRPYIGLIHGRYLKFGFPKWPLTESKNPFLNTTPYAVPKPILAHGGLQDASTLEDWTVAFNIRAMIPAAGPVGPGPEHLILEIPPVQTEMRRHK